jgi:hypothetical protein
LLFLLRLPLSAGSGLESGLKCGSGTAGGGLGESERLTVLGFTGGVSRRLTQFELYRVTSAAEGNRSFFEISTVVDVSDCPVTKLLDVQLS